MNNVCKPANRTMMNSSCKILQAEQLRQGTGRESFSSLAARYHGRSGLNTLPTHTRRRRIVEQCFQQETSEARISDSSAVFAQHLVCWLPSVPTDTTSWSSHAPIELQVS